MASCAIAELATAIKAAATKKILSSTSRAMQYTNDRHDLIVGAIKDAIQVLGLDHDMDIAFVGQFAEQRQVFQTRNRLADAPRDLLGRSRVPLQ
jgi:hypothetical protein